MGVCLPERSSGCLKVSCSLRIHYRLLYGAICDFSQACRRGLECKHIHVKNTTMLPSYCTQRDLFLLLQSGVVSKFPFDPLGLDSPTNAEKEIKNGRLAMVQLHLLLILPHLVHQLVWCIKLHGVLRGCIKISSCFCSISGCPPSQVLCRLTIATAALCAPFCCPLAQSIGNVQPICTQNGFHVLLLSFYLLLR